MLTRKKQEQEAGAGGRRQRQTAGAESRRQKAGGRKQKAKSRKRFHWTFEIFHEFFICH
jgi:hypothetical protein